MTVENMKHHLPESAQAYYVEESAIQDAEIPPAIESAAHILVSERPGKFDLAHLVGYLLTDLGAHEASNLIKTENLETLREQNAKLRKALQPFSKVFEDGFKGSIFENREDSCEVLCHQKINAAVTIGDFKAARAALGERE